MVGSALACLRVLGAVNQGKSFAIYRRLSAPATFFDGHPDGKIPTAACDCFEIQLLAGAGDN
jgi:hypothetical protein